MYTIIEQFHNLGPLYYLQSYECKMLQRLDMTNVVKNVHSMRKPVKVAQYVQDKRTCKRASKYRSKCHDVKIWFF